MVAVLPVEALDWPPEVMTVIMAGVAALKGWIAKQVGDPARRARSASPGTQRLKR